MSEDFRLYVDLFQHPKALKIQRVIGAAGVYCLIRLWAYATKYHPDGNLEGMDRYDLEVASGWHEVDYDQEVREGADMDSFTPLLVEVGFLDGDTKSGYRLHDWADWQPWVVKAPERKRLARLAGKASANARSTERQRSVERSVGRKASGRLNGKPTQRSPNPQIPDPRSPDPNTTTLDRPAKNDGFDRFWSAYPRKVGKGAALKAWRKVHPTLGTEDAIVAAVEAQKGWPAWQRDGGQFIPHPATWLNQGRWDDEGLAPEPDWKDGL